MTVDPMLLTAAGIALMFLAMTAASGWVSLPRAVQDRSLWLAELIVVATVVAVMTTIVGALGSLGFLAAVIRAL